MNQRHVSHKGVVLDGSRVLLARNHREQWELPGGRAGPNEAPEDAVVREIAEETGLAVRVDATVHVEDFEVLPGRWVTIEAFRCVPNGDLGVGPSEEHLEVAWFPTNGLPDELPDVYRRSIAKAVIDGPRHRRTTASA